MARVLMIEDDPALQEMYKMKFVHDGFEFVLAGDGQEGINKMKMYHPDVVLLDLILPRMTGFSVIDIVKNDPSINQIPIIVMTNIYADAEDLIKNHGIKSFIIKANVSLDEVVQKVRSLIETPAQPQQ